MIRESQPFSMDKIYQQPLILEAGKNTSEDLETLKRREKIWNTVDIYEQQLKELFEINNPSLVGSKDYEEQQKVFIKERTQQNDAGLIGNWIYFPWSGVLLHAVTEEEHLMLRTNRNRNLITPVEQKKLYEATVGIVGLSIGNTMALSLIHTGVGGALKLAEYDTLETTNLNRIRARLDQVGAPKLKITTEQIYEINPYARLELYPDGLNKKNIDDYVNKNPRPSIIIEAIDDFEMKIRIRLAARKAQIPVIMLTNLGDNILVDVERYDQDKELPLFNGLIGSLAEEILEKPIPEEDKQKYAIEIVGKENIPKIAFESAMEVGKTLVGRPQLMSTLSVSGGIATYLARKIILDEPLPSGRRLVKLSETSPPFPAQH